GRSDQRVHELAVLVRGEPVGRATGVYRHVRERRARARGAPLVGAGEASGRERVGDRGDRLDRREQVVATLSHSELETLWVLHGGTQQSADMSAAIAQAESGGCQYAKHG